MSAKAETKATQACIAFIKGLPNGDAYHTHGSVMQRRGEPDITGNFDYGGKKFFHLKVEVKTPEGTLSELQLERLRRYAAAGYYTAVVTSVDELAKAIWYFVHSGHRKWGYDNAGTTTTQE